MPHSGKFNQDRGYIPRENPNYFDKRSRPPNSSGGRLSQGTTEHSRSSSAFADPEPNHLGPRQGYDNPPPPYYHSKKTFSEKCSNLCSRRGVLQFIEVTVNILVLICIGATQAGISGFTSLGGLGSFNINSFYSPFQGTELQEVTELDMQYSQMRAPCVYGGVAFSLTMMCLTLLFLISGAKPIHRLSLGWLAAECLFDILACLGYIVAVGLYLHFVIQVNATDVCLKRERLYARRGYTSMNCSVQGGDASVALFGLVAACLYFGSLVVCILTIREVRQFQKQRDNSRYNLERTYREDNHPKPYRSKENIHPERTFGTLV
ncbi:MARVEL domain-containing protein 3-like [Pantherophis guttatus]|uniref:MARVEL domain-containing protein 3-like n=1 Tax=Pantherophis guttatus TaxID=94885 RepID=A0A6P9CZW7_PANGU|nr:MARVEL domain-containing protein 3-like [Pantherophis guttatus]